MANFTGNSRTLSTVGVIATASGGNFAGASRSIPTTIGIIATASGGTYATTPRSLSATTAIYVALAGANYSGSNHSFPATPLIEGPKNSGNYQTSVWPSRNLSIINSVWDSIAGRIVTWRTQQPDPQGQFYPSGSGYGAFGTNTSGYTYVGRDRTGWN